MLTVLGSILSLKVVFPFIVDFVISVFMLLTGIKWLLKKNKEERTLNYIDLFLMALTGLAILSTCWSTNISLTFHQSVYLATLSMIVLTVRIVSIEKLKLSIYLFCSIALGILLISFTYLSYPTFIETSLVRNLGMNSNSASFYLLVCCVFLLNYIWHSKSTVHKLLWGVLAIWSFILILRMASIGNMLVFICILSLFFLKKSKSVLLNKKILSFGFLGLLTAFILFFILSPNSEIIHQLATEGDRQAEFKLSYLLAREKCLLGHGFGNWKTVAYMHPLSDLSLHMNNQYFDARDFLGSHNIFSKMLGELGILGLGIFSLIIFIPIIYYIRKKVKFSVFQESCFWTFCAYILNRLFVPSSHHQGFYSKNLHKTPII